MRALIDPLDDVTDQQIVTAMRHEITLWRGDWKKTANYRRDRSQN
jgi:hypothetical protein